MENALQAMMKHFRIFIAMGFMIVAIALLVGAWNSAQAAGYYAVDKITRDTAGTGTALAQTRATIESTLAWLPYFKFLGLAMILAGITMAVGVIATRLQNLGKRAMASVPESVRQPIPPRPASVWLMRGAMMMGMLIILAGFIFSLTVAGQASLYWNHSIAGQLDVAPAGSALQNQIQFIAWAEGWLEALKFVGVAFFFLGIIQGLKTIITALRVQQGILPAVLKDLHAQETRAPARAA